MKKLSQTLTASLLLILIAVPNCRAEQATQDDIFRMLKDSGLIESLVPMQKQMIASLSAQVKSMYPNLPPEADPIIKEELKKGTAETLPTLLKPQLEFYSKHLTKEEVDALITYYQQPVVKKKTELDALLLRELQGQRIRDIQQEVANHLAYRVLQGLVRNNYMSKEEAGI